MITATITITRYMKGNPVVGTVTVDFANKGYNKALNNYIDLIIRNSNYAVGVGTEDRVCDISIDSLKPKEV